MENNDFKSLLGYKSAMPQARVMLSKGLINATEYGVIEKKMGEIFGNNSISLYRENDWINTPFRGNMYAEKEVV